MAGYKVEICGVNTANLPILSQDEMERLMIQIKAGDEEARQIFIYGNLRLVLSIVSRFSSNNENMDDLFQVGCVGLIKAIQNFDVSLGLKFATYAHPMILGELKRYHRDSASSSIRISRSVRDIAYKTIYAKENYLRKYNKEPTIEDLEKETGICKEDIIYAMEAIQSPVSLYEPVYTEGGDTLCIMDQVSDKKDSEGHWVNQLAIEEAMTHLAPREAKIIRMRFYEGCTQMETANELSISQAQISRIEKSALKNMKCYLT